MYVASADNLHFWFVWSVRIFECLNWFSIFLFANFILRDSISQHRLDKTFVFSRFAQWTERQWDHVPIEKIFLRTKNVHMRNRTLATMNMRDVIWTGKPQKITKTYSEVEWASTRCVCQLTSSIGHHLTAQSTKKVFPRVPIINVHQKTSSSCCDRKWTMGYYSRKCYFWVANCNALKVSTHREKFLFVFAIFDIFHMYIIPLLDESFALKEHEFQLEPCSSVLGAISFYCPNYDEICDAYGRRRQQVA